MEGTVRNRNVQPADEKELVIDTARLLSEHNGTDTVALYIGEISSWTDYFVITTVTSQAHARGLMRHLDEFLTGRNVEPSARPKHLDMEKNGWVLMDCGNFVIHIMSRQAREFYELERLWFTGDVVFGSVEGK